MLNMASGKRRKSKMNRAQRYTLVLAGTLLYLAVAIGLFYASNHLWLSTCGAVRISFLDHEPTMPTVLTCVLSGIGLLAYLPVAGGGASSSP